MVDSSVGVTFVVQHLISAVEENKHEDFFVLTADFHFGKIYDFPGTFYDIAVGKFFFKIGTAKFPYEDDESCTVFTDTRNGA